MVSTQSTTKLIWAAGLGFLWFGEVPTVFTWAGGAMIFVSTTYIALREHRLRKAKEPATAGGEPGREQF